MKHDDGFEVEVLARILFILLVLGGIISTLFGLFSIKVLVGLLLQ